MLGVLGSVGVLWLVAGILTWRDTHHELDELLDAHLSQSAALLIAQQAHDCKDDDHLMDPPPLHRYSPHVVFQVWHEGQLVLRSPNAPQAPMAQITEGFETRKMDGRAWRFFATRGGESDLQVYVGEQHSARDDILGAVLKAVLGPLVLALPLIGLAAWWAIRRGLAPLRMLSDQLAHRRPQELTAVRLPQGGELAEMRPMLDALNGLLARIGTLIEAERRFTADAAHELRNPIAAIRTQAQVALGASDAAEQRHALQSTLAGCDLITHLVTQLLTLSRLEASSGNFDGHAGSGTANATGNTGGGGLRPLDLAELAQRSAAELALTALDRHQTLSLDATACPVLGEPVLVGVLLRNLIDNALRYSPEGAAVTLKVGLNAQGRGQLSVEDSGPGLSDAEMARLGERFFRVLGTGASGSGLGWSIVRRIASALGAQVQTDRSPLLGGLRVRVTWPRVEGAGNGGGVQ